VVISLVHIKSSSSTPKTSSRFGASTSQSTTINSPYHAITIARDAERVLLPTPPFPERTVSFFI